MTHLARHGLSAALALVMIFGACQSGDSSGGGPCTTELRPPAEQILDDSSGKTLANAVAEYVPSDDELKLAAAFWALLAVGYQDDNLAPAFFEAALDEQVMAMTLHYPSYFSACLPRSGLTPTRTQPMAEAAGDCSCEASCLPSKSDVAGLLWDAGALGMSIFSKTTQAKALVVKIRFYADDVVNKVNAVKDFKKAMGQGFTSYDATRAIINGVSKADALSVLEGVGGFITVSGAIASAAVVAGATAPGIATIAAVGAVVGAGIAGAKLGTKMSNLATAYSTCAACQALKCDVGTGATGGTSGTSGTSGSSGSSGTGGTSTGCPTVPCTSPQVCLDGVCVDPSSATTCALRSPSCCPGHDDSCTAPDSACFCDAYCTTAGDCCPDACSVCGFCG